MLNLKEDGYITARSAANATGLAIQTIYRWVYKGKLTGTKIGDNWFIEVEDLLTHFEAFPSVQKKIRQELHS